MDHPVAVRADQSEILESCCGLACLMEWFDMVAFNEPFASFAVDLTKVKAAGFTGNLSVGLKGCFDLLLL